MAQLDNYLPCEAYANQPAAEGHEGFTQFQDEASGLHYFAMVDKNGHVVLRSEAYESSERRDEGIESVIRNRDIEARWVKSKDGENHHYLSLRADGDQEIARTCSFDSEGALLGWWLPFAAGAYAWGRADVEKAIPAEVVAERVAAAPPVLPPPVVLSVKKETSPPPPPPPPSAGRAAATARGSNGWEYLLLIAAALGLLWLLLRGCGG